MVQRIVIRIRINLPDLRIRSITITILNMRIELSKGILFDSNGLSILSAAFWRMLRSQFLCRDISR